MAALLALHCRFRIACSCCRAKDEHERTTSFPHQQLHAYVYFEASSRATAWALRETINMELTGQMEMGRFHEKPVGPHPMWSYQLVFPAASFSHVVSWLALNHGALDVFVHPNTDDELRDHRDCAIWLGSSHTLNLVALVG